MQSNIKKALDNATDRLENLNQLAKRINWATDAKAIADLNARINIEQLLFRMNKHVCNCA